MQNGNYAGLGSSTTDASGACVLIVDPGSNAIRAIIDSGAGYNVTSVWYEAANRTIEVKLPDSGKFQAPSSSTTWPPVTRSWSWTTAGSSILRPITFHSRTVS